MQPPRSVRPSEATLPIRAALVFTIAATAAFMPAARANAQTPASPQHAVHAPGMPLFEDVLGSYTWPVTTSVKTAQSYFDQGVRLMYAYGRADARRSFEQARTADVACAMCWWGEAWAMGPYLNGAMNDADAAAAHAAVQRARSHSASATPLEAALIEALAARYAPTHPAHGRRGLDSVYARAMAAVYERFPENVDVATLYADALMLLEPRRGVWPLEKPSVQRIHEVLERALEGNLAHPGACHAYVHATETTPKVSDAQACADLLGSSIPGASHINHMPSHTYNRVGRWGDATRANIEAWHTDLRAGQGEAFAIYPAHNLHMLLFSASVDGQGAIAIQAARDYSRLVPVDGMSLRALTLVRFGRFDEVLELTQAPAHPVHRGLWAFGRGLAHLRLERPDSARSYLGLVDSLATHTPAERGFRVHQPATLLGIVGGILRGELLRSDGRADEATVAFRDAASLEASLIYDEPEPLPFTTHDFLGALLLETGRAAEAQHVYETALTHRPHNGWSLFGLEQALRAQGRTAEADEALRRFERAWQRSEVLIRASRF